jgi:hypothetical protein
VHPEISGEKQTATEEVKTVVEEPVSVTEKPVEVPQSIEEPAAEENDAG